MNLTLPILAHQDMEEGVYTGWLKDFPNIIAEGKDEDELKRNLIIGIEHAMRSNGTLCLQVKYGVDQELGIDRILLQMAKEGKIKSSEKLGRDEEFVAYRIFFDNVYNLYAFGHRQGQMSTGLL